MNELIIAIAIFSIVGGLAVPSFRSTLANNRMVTLSNALRGAALKARSTAISLNQRVTFCAGRPETGCHGNWNLQQWLVFRDQDNDGLADPAEVIFLTSNSPASSAAALSGNGPFRNRVIFTSSGTAITSTGAFAAGRLRVCALQGGGVNNAIDLVLIGSGRLESEFRTVASPCDPL